MAGGRPFGSKNASQRRIMAVRLAIEERLKKSLPEKIVDLIEQMHDKQDQVHGYIALLPYCYPKLQVQTIVDAEDMGIETQANIDKRAEEWKQLQATKNELAVIVESVKG